LGEKKEEDCDDCDFTVGVSITESVCNFLGEESKEKCEEIIKKVKDGEKTFGESISEIKTGFVKSLEVINEMKKIAEEKGFLNATAKPK
jgi:hypothetical protein